MFAIISVSTSPQFLAPQNGVLNTPFSSKKSAAAVNGDGPKQSSTISYLIDARELSSKDALCVSNKLSSAVNGDDPERSSTISYLMNTCGFSFKDALFVSKKITIKSPENPDSVLELLRKYGFTNANINKLIIKWPKVLLSCPEKTLLPKLNFFHSIGVPLDVLARKISSNPLILQRSLEHYLIPLYDYLKTLLQSDKRVVNVFIRAPRAFAHSWQREFRTNVAILRERGIPESSITSLVVNQPSVFVISTQKLTSCINRAAEMGFDRSKLVFANAIQVFASMSERTLNHKMEAYRRCGWSESDISLAFLKHPLCMKLSEKKIMDTMHFLVNDLGLNPFSVARLPILVSLNIDRRMKPRYLVARVLKEKGLLTKRMNVSTFLKLSEESFLKRYIVDHQHDIPELLDIYRGKLSVSEMKFSPQVIFKCSYCSVRTTSHL